MKIIQVTLLMFHVPLRYMYKVGKYICMNEVLLLLVILTQRCEATTAYACSISPNPHYSMGLSQQYCMVFQYLQGTSSSQFSTPQLTPSVSDTEYGSSEVSTLISIFMHFLM